MSTYASRLAIHFLKSANRAVDMTELLALDAMDDGRPVVGKQQLDHLVNIGRVGRAKSHTREYVIADVNERTDSERCLALLECCASSLSMGDFTAAGANPSALRNLAMRGLCAEDDGLWLPKGDTLRVRQAVARALANKPTRSEIYEGQAETAFRLLVEAGGGPLRMSYFMSHGVGQATIHRFVVSGHIIPEDGKRGMFRLASGVVSPPPSKPVSLQRKARTTEAVQWAQERGDVFSVTEFEAAGYSRRLAHYLAAHKHLRHVVEHAAFYAAMSVIIPDDVIQRLLEAEAKPTMTPIQAVKCVRQVCRPMTAWEMALHGISVIQAQRLAQAGRLLKTVDGRYLATPTTPKPRQPRIGISKGIKRLLTLAAEFNAAGLPLTTPDLRTAKINDVTVGTAIKRGLLLRLKRGHFALPGVKPVELPPTTQADLLVEAIRKSADGLLLTRDAARMGFPRDSIYAAVAEGRVILHSRGTLALPPKAE